MNQLIECVPNISEGRNPAIYNAIAHEVTTVEGITLLDVDPGKATNRTVITFVGEPPAVIEAAFRLIKKAAELIDMSKHSGEHPRMGATDVCPLVPIRNIDVEECAKWAHQLGERVGRELGIPGFYYEKAAKEEKRRNLANCRQGEYEGLAKKFQDPTWQPDFGTADAKIFGRTGATAIGARGFLVAYNINLNTTSTRRANAIAFDIRERGRVKREGDPLTGKVVTDENGNPVHIPGKLKAVKGIGWYIEEYGIAQISYNLTDIGITSMHQAFEETVKAADSRGIRVTGSELVGLVPLQAMLDAGKYFLKKQGRSRGIPEQEILKIAIKSLGLDELKPFHPEERIIEYKLGLKSPGPLVSKTLVDFANETARESPAPGGGSVAAYAGAMGAALGAMVANLSAHKRGWDHRWEEFSEVAEAAMVSQQRFLQLVDEDTAAFNAIMDAFALPKKSEEEMALRNAAIQAATRLAMEVPFETLQLAASTLSVLQQMVEKGNPNSITDAAVGALCCRTAAEGAYLNVLVNAQGYTDPDFSTQLVAQAQETRRKVIQEVQDLLTIVENQLT